MKVCPYRGRKASTVVSLRKRFQGQTSWHTSQPYSQPSRLLRMSSGNSTSGLVSIVQYEMQRRASTTYGSTIAFVGHASIQAVHVPQWSAIGSSGSRSIVEITTPKKKKLPMSRRKMLLCFPCQPNPDRTAHCFSKTGPVSMYRLCSIVGSSCFIFSARLARGTASTS